VEIPWLDRDCSVPARPGVGSTRLFTDARRAHLARLDPLDRGRARSHHEPDPPCRTASLVAGFYLDGIADAVEHEIDPLGPRGRPLPLPASLYLGLQFAGLSLLVNLAVLALTLFTGVGFAAFVVLNGYLLGREYFELAAMRHLPFPQAVELRRQRSFDVFIAGMIVAGFVAVPVLNLFTPLFATAFMTRMMKRLV
jgi:CysZ protein